MRFVSLNVNLIVFRVGDSNRRNTLLLVGEWIYLSLRVLKLYAILKFGH